MTQARGLCIDKIRSLGGPQRSLIKHLDLACGMPQVAARLVVLVAIRPLRFTTIHARRGRESPRPNSSWAIPALGDA
jgi:hypothetical protein